MKTAGRANPALLLYQLFWGALDWIFPPTCGGCNTPGTHWCETCQAKIILLEHPICPKCGDSQKNETICPACHSNPPHYVMLRSFSVFDGPIREALHHLKYGRDIGLGEPLSKHLVELYNRDKWAVDLVVPVPLSPQRLKKRGYNQAALLGRSFAIGIQAQYRTDTLYKQRETRTQVGLSALERHQNVDGAFAVNSTHVHGKVILVVDDVTTTGSTINACAKALSMAGASAVYGLTLARAVLQADADDQPKTIS